MEVTLVIPIEMVTQEVNFQKIQTSIKYRNERGKAVRLRPEDAEEVRFTHNGIPVRMVSLPNTIELGGANYQGERIFLQLVTEGSVSVYSYEYRDGIPLGYGMATFDVDRLILHKQTRTLMRVRSESFRKDMSLYFGECPELAQKIRDKELRKKDIFSIVEYYNRECAE